MMLMFTNVLLRRPTSMMCPFTILLYELHKPLSFKFSGDNIILYLNYLGHSALFYDHNEYTILHSSC